MAEFDESIPLDDSSKQNADGDLVESNGMVGSKLNEMDPLTRYMVERPCRLAQSKPVSLSAIEDQVETMEQMVERELVQFESELKPIERFGVRVVECQREEMLSEELVMADVCLNRIFI